MARRKSLKKMIACAVSVMMLAGGTSGITQTWAASNTKAAAESVLEDPEEAALVGASDETAAPQESVEVPAEPEVTVGEPEAEEEPADEIDETEADDGSGEDEWTETPDEEPSVDSEETGDEDGNGDGGEDVPAGEDDGQDDEEEPDDTGSESTWETPTESEQEDPGTDSGETPDDGEENGDDGEESTPDDTPSESETSPADSGDSGTDSGNESSEETPDDVTGDSTDSEADPVGGADSEAESIDEILSIAESVPEEIAGEGEKKGLELPAVAVGGDAKAEIQGYLDALSDYGIIVSGKFTMNADQDSNLAVTNYTSDKDGRKAGPQSAGGREIPYIVLSPGKTLNIPDGLPGTVSVRTHTSKDAQIVSGTENVRRVYEEYSGSLGKNELTALAGDTSKASSRINSAASSASGKITAAEDGGRCVVDTTGDAYGKDAFIVIRADDLVPYLTQNKLTVKKKAGQTIAFNITQGAETLKIGKYTVEADGTAVVSDSTPDSIRNTIARKIIWNVRQASDVQLVNTAGTFLIHKVEGGSGTAAATIVGDSGGTVAVLGNLTAKAAWHYVKTGRTPTATLAVKKVSANPAVSVPDSTFTFTLTAVEGAPMPKSEETMNGPDGFATFEPIKFDASSAGAEYIYRIDETGSDSKNWSISDKPVYAKVTIAESGKAVVTYHDDEACKTEGEKVKEVVNTYTLPATLEAYKTLVIQEGAELGTIPDFTLKLTPKTAGRAGDADTKKITLVQEEGSEESELKGSVKFKTLRFSEAGTYEYEISEVDESKQHPNYTYDRSTILMTIKVAEEGGKLKATASLTRKNGSETTRTGSIRFTNYCGSVKPANVSFGVKKTLTVKKGFELKEDSIPDFSFNLVPKNGANGDSSQTIKVSGGNGEASFDKLTFREEGTFVYEISESDESSSHAGFAYDKSVYTATVKVKRSGNEYKATVTYQKDSGEEHNGSTALRFTFGNQYAPEPIYPTFNIVKEITGEPEKEDTFSFTLKRGDETRGTAEIIGDGTAEIKSSATIPQPGTYKYTISEAAGSAECLYDSSVYNATVTVTDNNGILEAKVAYAKQGSDSAYTEAVFVNQYLTTGSFRFYKVRYDNQNQGVKDARYAIYRITAEDRQSDAYKAAAKELASGVVDFNKLTKVTTYVSESNGKVVFDDLKAETFYVIREEEAPKGYQISKNPIVIHTSFTNGEFGVELTSSGANTAGKDPASGLYKWYEHRVKVVISKKKTNGELLAGAKLRLIDTTTNQAVEAWTSKSSSGHEIVVKLQTGRKYTITETSAPKGYEKAADVTFTVEDHPCTSSDYYQYVSVIDKATGSGGSGGSGSGGSGSGSGTESGASGSTTRTDASKTGDSSPIAQWLIILIVAAAAVAAVLLIGRKKKR